MMEWRGHSNDELYSHIEERPKDLLVRPSWVRPLSESIHKKGLLFEMSFQPLSLLSSIPPEYRDISSERRRALVFGFR